jgi:hypothetical protein
MNCFVELVDASTGEIYYNKNLGYAFAIGMPNDVGMKKIKEIVESAIRGARIKRTPLQLRLCFTEPQPTLSLPFQDVNELKTPYEIKPF